MVEEEMVEEMVEEEIVEEMVEEEIVEEMVEEGFRSRHHCRSRRHRLLLRLCKL